MSGHPLLRLSCRLRPAFEPRARSTAARCILTCFALAALLTAGCAHYVPAPVSPGQSLEDFEARRLDAPELQRHLERLGVTPDEHPGQWDLRRLTLAAFFYSPALDAARAEWGVARGGVVTAGSRPGPTVGAAVGYNTTTPTAEVTPWIFDAALDLPIDIAGRRGIRIAQARQLSEAARLNVLSAAWQVRSHVRQSFLELDAARRAASQLDAQQENQAEIVRILEYRRGAGDISPYEVSQARIALANGRTAVLENRQRRARALSELADAVGVPPAALDGVTLLPGEIGQLDLRPPEREIKLRALTGRADILAALAEYEAGQEALRLEVRKQYPDLSFGPAYQLDQTDIKWTLGISIALPPLNRNQGPITEAEARRSGLAARFLALQSAVFAELEQAIVSVGPAAEQLRLAEGLLEQLDAEQQASAEAYRIGEISKLELLTLRGEFIAAALSQLDALAGARAAFGSLEDAMQSPLDIGEWVLEPPAREPETGGLRND